MNLSKRIILSCLAVLVVLATTSVPASASSGEDLAGQKRVVERVFRSKDPKAALQKLTPKERALFVRSLDHLDSKIVESRFGPLSQAPDYATSPKMKAMTASVAATGGCWYHYNKQDWSDFNVYEGTTWMELHWCSNGSRITSYNLADSGGTGSVWADYKGIVSQNSKNVGWEVRYYVQFRFDFGFAQPTPCMQTRGGATGLYFDPRKTCNLN